MLNKRGQELSITSIILIIVGVAVLVLLIFGFVVGWDKILPWLSPGNNVETLVSQCQVACATGNTYGYCTMNRTLKAEDLPAVNGKKEISNESCQGLAKHYTQYNIAACPTLC